MNVCVYNLHRHIGPSPVSIVGHLSLGLNLCCKSKLVCCQCIHVSMSQNAHPRRHILYCVALSLCIVVGRLEYRARLWKGKWKRPFTNLENLWYGPKRITQSLSTVLGVSSTSSGGQASSQSAPTRTGNLSLTAAPGRQRGTRGHTSTVTTTGSWRIPRSWSAAICQRILPCSCSHGQSPPMNLRWWRIWDCPTSTSVYTRSANRSASSSLTRVTSHWSSVYRRIPNIRSGTRCTRRL